MELPKREREDAILRPAAQPEIRPSGDVGFRDRPTPFFQLNRWPRLFSEPNLKDQK